MLAAVIAEGVAIALLAVLVLGLLRSHALILRALHELGAGLELEKEATAAAGHESSPVGPVAVQIEPGVVPATRAESSAAHDVVGEDLEGAAQVELAGAGAPHDAPRVPHLGVQRVPDLLGGARPGHHHARPTPTSWSW